VVTAGLGLGDAGLGPGRRSGLGDGVLGPGWGGLGGVDMCIISP